MSLHVKAVISCIVILNLIVTQSIAMKPSTVEEVFDEVECSFEESCYTGSTSLLLYFLSFETMTISLKQNVAAAFEI